jgi:hypothetical protein
MYCPQTQTVLIVVLFDLKSSASTKPLDPAADELNKPTPPESSQD